MVNRCTPCGEYHWSYYKAPFKPFCSWDCWLNRRKFRDGTKNAKDVLAVIREHLRDVHNSHNLTDWFDCTMCELLQNRYAAALRNSAPVDPATQLHVVGMGKARRAG